MVTRPLITILYLLIAVVAFGQRSDSRLDSKIDEIFERFSGKTPGCAVGVAQDRTVLFAKAYGMADLKRDLPLSTTSAVYMASVSKQFAAMAILLLAEEGRLQTSDSIRKTIPELPDYANGITLYHLLTHTSGLRDYLTLGELTGRSLKYTDENVLRLIARQRSLNFEPGAEYLYSNSGYVLLSLVVKRVTQQNLNEFARQHIFLPLGMNSSRFQHDHSASLPGKASGYVQTPNGWTVANSPLDVVGDGGLYSSLEDMLLWTENFDRLRIGAKALAVMQTPGRLSNGNEIPYGMGLAPAQYRGLPVIEHGGALGGYRTEFLRFPGERFSVVCLCNSGSANPSELARRVADLYLSPAMKPAQAEPERRQSGIVLTPEELRSKTGLYQNEKFGYLDIVVRDGKLVPVGRAELVALDKLRFTASDLPPGFELVFDSESPVRGLVVRPPEDPPVQTPFRFERVASVKLSESEMKGYAGKFFSSELDTTGRITLNADSLMIEVGNSRRARLQTIRTDEMRIEQDEPTDIVFYRDSAGKIGGFYLNAGRVRKVQFERR